MTSIAI